MTQLTITSSALVSRSAFDKGGMSQAKCSDPAAFERGNYMKALTSFTGKPASSPCRATSSRSRRDTGGDSAALLY